MSLNLNTFLQVWESVTNVGECEKMSDNKGTITNKNIVKLWVLTPNAQSENIFETRFITW
jgi:hypothetical protein